MKPWRRAFSVAPLVALFVATPAEAFNSVISPPYHELQAKPGGVLRESITVTNLEAAPARFSAKTGDWDITDRGQVVFFEEPPKVGSCRPWVRIERREFSVSGRLTRPFRFEVEVPPDTKLRHCHFALFFEGITEAPPPPFKPAEEAKSAGFVVAGRLAAVIYLTIGDAAPRFEMRGFATERVGDRTYPVVILHNSGDAHGRPSGVIQAVDATGQRFEMVVEQVPVLPGHSRPVRIQPDDPLPPAPPLQYSLPLQINGVIEWRGGKVGIDTTIQ